MRPLSRPIRAFTAAVLVAGGLVTAVGTTAGVAAPTDVTASPPPSTTALLGTTSVPRIPRDGIAGSSPCPAGSFVVGARVWLDSFPRVTGAAALCGSGEDAPAVGEVVGDTSDADSHADSLCTGTDRAVGLRAANGEVVNALAVRCAGADGTYDAAEIGKPYVGNPSTTRYDADCDSGKALTGLLGWSNIYGGPHVNVYGVQGVCKVGTTTSITGVDPSSSVVGRPVTVSFAVTSSVPGLAPTGSVTVRAGSGESCSGAVSAVDGTGSCALTFQEAGSATVTATYVDDASFVGSTSAAVPYTVDTVPTTTTITASPNPAAVGELVTYTATVSPVPDGGTVAIGAHFGPAPGCEALPLDADGTATCSYSYQGEGTYPVYAVYSGDAGFLTSSDSVDEDVKAASQPQSITVTSTPPSPAYPTQTYSPTATAPGGDVQVTVDDVSTAVCSLDGTTVTFDHHGSCVLDFDQPGDGRFYAEADRVQQTITVKRISVSPSRALTTYPLVYGQDSSMTTVAKVDAGPADLVGTPVTVGSVEFHFGPNSSDPLPLDEDGTATWPSVLADGPVPAGNAIGLVTYDPPEGSDYVSTDDVHGSAYRVRQASTTTTVHVGTGSVSATVAAVSPGAGTPTGTVTFMLDGKSIGSATLKDGVASIARTVPPGRADEVGAAYSGDANFLASSRSATTHSVPTITAKVTSAKAKSRYGWYRTPVTVSFTCTAHGAPLTTPCPKSVTLSKNGASQSVSRTIAASDGGMATVTVRGIDIDRSAPSVRVSGTRNGARYTATAPRVGCSASDTVSGIASCRVTSRTASRRGAKVVTYTATATDRAGNTRRATATITVATFGFVDAPFSRGAYTVKRGHTYTLAGLTSGARPRYVDASPYPRKPKGLDNRFHAAGHVGSATRWALGVTMQQRLRSHRYWNVGVLVGKTLYVIKIRVV